MEDSSCLVQALPHAPENSTDEETKVTTVSAALGGSVSFGRFLSESLDWGKWSSFCQKRCLEEVEKYSTPGSVAQKKAYFEAHYKKAAARKSASLLEQANEVANNADLETKRNNGVESNDEQNANSFNVKPEPKELSTKLPHSEGEAEETLDSANEPNSGKENCGLEIDQLQKCVSIIKNKIITEPSSKTESSETADDVENQHKVNDIELGTNPLKKQPLKGSSLFNLENKDSIEKKPKVCASKPAVVHRPPRLPPSPASKLLSPAKSVPCARQNKSTPNSKHGTESNEKKKSTLRSVHLPMNFSQSRKGTATPMVNKTSPTIKKVEELKVVSTSKAIQDCSNHFATTIRASLNGRPKHASITRQSGHGSYSKSLDIRENRLQAQAAPSLSSRTEERVEKRKKFSHNLEEKFQGKEAKKLQLQEIAEGKPENDMKKLRQSLSFKARPLPAFYHSTTELPKVDKKVQLTKPQRLKLGKASNCEANSVPKFLPPSQPSSIKGDRSTRTRGNSSLVSRNSVTMKSKNQNSDSVSSSNN